MVLEDYYKKLSDNDRCHLRISTVKWLSRSACGAETLPTIPGGRQPDFHRRLGPSGLNRGDELDGHDLLFLVCEKVIDLLDVGIGKFLRLFLELLGLVL